MIPVELETLYVARLMPPGAETVPRTWEILMSFALLLSLALLSAGVGRAQGPDITHESGPLKRVRAQRISEPLKFDGVVDEPVWEEIDPATGFVQQNPDEGAAATEQTEVRIAFDDKYLYCGVICFDSQPQNIVMTQNRRDARLDDTDSIQILLDTFDDNQSGFVFGTTPTGIEYDGQLSKAGQSRGGVGAPARAGGVGGAGTSQRGGAAAFNLNWDGVWKVRSQAPLQRQIVLAEACRQVAVQTALQPHLPAPQAGHNRLAVRSCFR